MTHPGFKNLTGQRFGKLRVVAVNGRTAQGSTVWQCICDCGEVAIVRSGHLLRDEIISCGSGGDCSPVYKHGHMIGKKPSRTYKTWTSMIQRCTNKNSNRWEQYGGRGITICKRWSKFTNFLADMGERPNGMTIDRKDNNKGYHKLNCQWSTPKTQANNRRASTRKRAA